MKRRSLFLIVLAMAFPLGSWGQSGKTYPSNLELVQQAAKAAAERVAGQIPTSTRSIVLSQESPRTLDWAVEEAMTSALIHAGYQLFKSTPEADTAVPTLNYRTVDLGITYQDRSRSVERVARVRIAFSLTRGGTGQVLASGDGQGTAQDLVPSTLMAGLETPEIVPTRLPPKDSAGSRLLEPALLSAVVAGLIYLFYASKAAK